MAEGAARAKAWRPKSEDDHLARNTRWCRGKDEEREGEGKEEERNRWRRKGRRGEQRPGPDPNALRGRFITKF